MGGAPGKLLHEFQEGNTGFPEDLGEHAASSKQGTPGVACIFLLPCLVALD